MIASSFSPFLGLFSLLYPLHWHPKSPCLANKGPHRDPPHPQPASQHVVVTCSLPSSSHASAHYCCVEPAPRMLLLRRFSSLCILTGAPRATVRAMPISCATPHWSSGHRHATPRWLPAPDRASTGALLLVEPLRLSLAKHRRHPPLACCLQRVAPPPVVINASSTPC